MKQYWVIPLALLILFGFCGCGSDKPEKTDAMSQKDVEEHHAMLKLLGPASEKKAEMYLADLKSELGKALKSGGHLAAIKICHDEAPEVALKHANTGWQVYRATNRSRNKNNQADSLQADIFDRFLTYEDPPNFIYIWKDSTYYHFKPIIMSELCLSCHGDPGEMQPEIMAKIAEFYPEDSAFGYKVGELRGMFVVEVAWPLRKEHAEELISLSR